MRIDEMMIDQLKTVFPANPVEACLECDSRELFYICDGDESATDDNDKKAYITGATSSLNSFTIRNPNKKIINHLAIDHCFFGTTYTGKRCDCIIFDDTYFCFVELKLNLESRQNAKTHVRKAMEQLGAVIQEFRDTNSINFLEFVLQAFIVMHRRRYPKDDASRKARAENFLTQYKVELFERNEKHF